MVCGTTDILMQIAKKYAFSMTFNEQNTTKKVSTEECLYQKKQIIINKHYSEVFDKHGIPLKENENFIIYRRLKKHGHTHTSITKPESKSADYFLLLNDTMGIAEFYFKFAEKNYVYLKKYVVNYKHYHLTEVNSLGQSDIFECDHIKSKVLYLKCNGIEYTSEEPPAHSQ